MSVEVPVIDSWDGEARRIYLKSGVETFHWIEDIYREYRYWRRTDVTSRKWLPFMRAAGNEAKGGGKYTPRYVTLLDGARVIPYDENILITVTGEAITDNPEVDADPFDTTSRTQAVKIYITPPSSELVRAEAEIAAVNRMQFGEAVSVDVVYGIAGTTGTIGTPGNPVNNLTHALVIAQTNGFKTLNIRESMEIDTSSNFTGFSFIGESVTKTLMTVTASANVTKCEFYETMIAGTLDGENKLQNCMLHGINYVNGVIQDCLLEEYTTTLGGGVDAYFLNCWSAVAGVNTPTIDMGASGQNLGLRNYNGGLKIINMSGTADNISLDLNSARVILGDTITAGTVVCRGIGDLVDESGNTIYSGTWNGGVTIVNRALSIRTISEAVWDDTVASYPTAGSTGKALSDASAGSSPSVVASAVWDNSKALTTGKFLGLK